MERIFDPATVKQSRRRRRLSDIAYEAIREAIVTGRIEPGQWLRQEVLARELEMNQVTVREALRQLVAEGLAEHEPNRGVRAAAPPIEELEELGEIRALLEGLAMERAAAHISPEELARMREILSQMWPDTTEHELDTVWKNNREFHWIAIRASGQQHVMRILGQIWDLMNPQLMAARPLTRVSQKSPSEDNVQHAQLLEALEARDGKRAREITIEHVRFPIRHVRGATFDENQEG